MLILIISGAVIVALGVAVFIGKACSLFPLNIDEIGRQQDKERTSRLDEFERQRMIEKNGKRK